MTGERSTTAVTAAAEAFDRIAPEYDETWTESLIGGLQRRAVWRVLDQEFQPGDRVLDLGCGTGVDAIHLARRGVSVHGMDISAGMVAEAGRNVRRLGLDGEVSLERRAIEELPSLQASQLFDGAISNFSPLNCVEAMEPVARQLARLVRPGGRLVLCLMTRFCLWETLWYPLTGQLYKVARRWNGGRAVGSVNGKGSFEVYYPSVRELKRAFASEFHARQLIGVGVFAPPSYLEPLAQRWPRVTRGLARLDSRVRRWPLLRVLGDHVLVVFERVED